MKESIIILEIFLLISCKTLNPVVDNLKTGLSTFQEKSEVKSYDEEKDTNNWDLSLLDTAINETTLSRIEKNVILEVNKVRTNPQKYVKLYIEPLQKRFQGNEFHNGTETIITSEGKRAVDECIFALNRTKPMGALLPDKRLSDMAAYHRNLQGPTEQTGHTSPNGKKMEDRSKMFIGNNVYIGENISYGSETARKIVLQLLIDDGVPSRGHRKNIMNSTYEYIGVSFGTHKKYRNMTVMNLLKM